MTNAIKDASACGAISYNGIDFGGAGSTPPIYSIKGEPVYDDADRTITHVRYTLELETIIYGEDEEKTALLISQIRTALARPGRKLIIQDIGFGDTEVQKGSSHPDIAWGAKPRIISLEPIGGMIAWRLAWRCEFNVSETGRSGVNEKSWLAFNYRMTFSVDDNGFTTRTAAGHIRIVQVRGKNGQTRIDQTADQTRDALAIHVPDGFRRVQSQWTESEDKTRLDFTVVDEELRSGPFPPGISDANVRYSLASDGPGFARSVARLDGWMESAPTAAPSEAIVRWIALAQDRMRRLMAGSAACGGGMVVPLNLKVSRELFGRKTWFSAEFRAVHRIESLIARCGMWTPVAGTDYRQWRASVEGLWSNRGRANLRSNLSDAAIIDLGDNPTHRMAIGVGGSPVNQASGMIPMVGLESFLTAANSWFDFQASIRVTRKENVSLHTLAKKIKTKSGSSTSGVGQPFSVSSPSRIRERHGEPIQQVHFQGVAVRLKYKPFVPVLSSVGGRTLVEHSRSEKRSELTHYGGAIAYRVEWSVVYDLSGYVRNHNGPTNLAVEGGNAWKSNL